MDNISFDDFKKVELVLAEITECKEHPNADRLYVVQVDLGDEKRQLVAGIRHAYTAEELVGKKVIMVKNLEPATIRGEESQGMILALSDEENLSVLSPERTIALGSRAK
ncbi:MAG: methionyl-tRNA synthetase [Lysobacterales bacterium]|jgi:methionyl-tRNA synthetase